MTSRPTPLLHRFVASALVAALALYPAKAHASLFGEENGPLTALVGLIGTELTQFASLIKTAEDAYEETKKYVKMAQDVRDAFIDVKGFAESVLTNPQAAFENLFPDVATIRREVQSPDSWKHGTGELQRRIRLCLNGETGCTEFYERVRGDQAQKAITDTYGTLPADLTRNDVAATDAEAALALVSASMHEGKAAMARQQYEALLSKCTRDGDVTQCQAAANMAAILQAKGTADTNELLATSNRLQAVSLANQSAAQKREVLEANQRAKAVGEGFRDMQRGVQLVPTSDDPRSANYVELPSGVVP